MPVPVRGRVGVYDMVVADFIANVIDSDVEPKSAKITLPGKKFKTAQIGLSKAVQLSGRKDIKVSLVNNEPYLSLK